MRTLYLAGNGVKAGKKRVESQVLGSGLELNREVNMELRAK
jgi:hypothetical protein